MGADEGRRIHATVAGRVQGVYYRASTRAEAERLGLAGWVRNLADGRVELEAQGRPAAVAALIVWLEQGPPAARVERVDVREVEIREGQAELGAMGFEVRR